MCYKTGDLGPEIKILRWKETSRYRESYVQKVTPIYAEGAGWGFLDKGMYYFRSVEAHTLKEIVLACQNMNYLKWDIELK